MHIEVSDGLIDQFRKGIDARQLMSEAKFYESYARYNDDLGRYETWDESVERVMKMHREYYADKMTPELSAILDEVEQGYKDKLFLGSQRALQFGGEQLLRNHSRLYNCSSTYLDRVDAFAEIFHLMLSGCGVGFSVQDRHIKHMPNIKRRTDEFVTFVIPDSIEGWAESVDVLLSSFFVSSGRNPQYRGKKIKFDYSQIRPRGSFVSGGFKAPGPDGLKKSLEKIEALLVKAIEDGKDRLTSIELYDIVMYIADAVLSGGIRRAATICMFTHTDELMLKAKTGDWWQTNPERGRSNNSAMLLRGSVTKEEFEHMMKFVKDYGEPGFIWVDDLDALFNPCVEIGLYGYNRKGESGFGVCNLTEINGVLSISKEIFLKQCKLASIMGTLQAGYTDFKFVSKITKEIVEEEALLGVSITGWMNNPDILFNEDILGAGAEEVLYWNEVTAGLIGINVAARALTVKPSGNASTLLGSASGIHGEHSKMYLRHTQFNKETEIAKLFMEHYPKMVEDSVWGSNDVVVAFPVVPKEGSIYKSDLLGVKQLEYVVKAQKYWVAKGTRKERGLQPWLVHNVSNTITVDDWDEVTDFIYDNRQHLGGVSLLASLGDKAYPQAPFTEVLTLEEVVNKYGVSAMFASGLIEAGLTAFDGDLWNAISTASGYGEKLSNSAIDLLKRDFVRRFHKFSHRFLPEDESITDYITHYNKYERLVNKIENLKLELSELDRDLIANSNKYISISEDIIKYSKELEDIKEYLNSDEITKHKNLSIIECGNCLKDVYNLHKWINITNSLKEELSWVNLLTEKKYTDLDTLAGAACAGGKCEI